MRLFGKIRIRLVALPAVALLSTAPSARAQRSLFVNSTGDSPDALVDGTACETSTSGECTLRAAIEEANFDPDFDSIYFSIPGTDGGCSAGVCTISPATELPSITAAVEIVGASQPGATCGSSFVGRDLRIVIDGSALASGSGLTVQGGIGTLIIGLVISNFPFAGIRNAGGSSTVYTCNMIGSDVTGTTDQGNGSFGIYISSGNRVRVGTDDNGFTDDSEGNLISGNGNGIRVDAVTGTKIAGNLIGVQLDGVSSLPNSIGVNLFNSSNSLIGGSDAIEGNTIAKNVASGISIWTTAGTGNQIQQNSMFSNGALGIDILSTVGVNPNDSADVDVGPNNLQNYPVVSEAGVVNANLSVTYTVDSDTANSEYPLTVEFFIADADQQEGQTFVARDTFTVADWSTCGTPPCEKTAVFDSAGVAVGDTLVTTATDSMGSTSEFSMPVEVTDGASVALRVRAFLEGPYSGGSMATTLRDNDDVPLSQPFSDAFFNGTDLDYDSTQSVGALPDSTVDWVLVSLRTGTSAATEVAGSEFAALIYAGGTVASTGEDSLRFPGLSDGSYYLVLRARNHLDVMSSSAVTVSGSVGSWDFTTATGQAYGTAPMKDLGGGDWGLYAGDGNVDGQTTVLDFTQWLSETTSGATGYQPGDFNMDHQVTVLDFTKWLANTTAGATSRVPN